MNDFWRNKPDFWRNKTKDNEIYLSQAKEIRADLNYFRMEFGAKNFADIGGYEGRIGIGKSFDIHNGFDLTKNWNEQKFPKNIDVCFTSLTLICFPPDEAAKIIRKMIEKSKMGIYLFEEKAGVNIDNGGKISDEYGGKWAYDWFEVLKDLKKDYEFNSWILSSVVNPRWVRIFITKSR